MVSSEGDSQNGRDVPLRLEAPRRVCEGERGNGIGYHANHANRSLECEVRNASSVSDLARRNIRTCVVGIASGDDAVEPHGLTSTAVEAGEMVVRPTFVKEEHIRIMLNKPGKRFDGILDGSQLLRELRSVDTLYNERRPLTSDRLETWGEADWGKGAGVEEGGWVRTESIV